VGLCSFAAGHGGTPKPIRHERIEAMETLANGGNPCFDPLDDAFFARNEDLDVLLLAAWRQSGVPKRGPDTRNV
jgi:hypothetical protein